ncbi:glycoside hydrolase family 97 protein [Halosimplex sp. J119]
MELTGPNGATTAVFDPEDATLAVERDGTTLVTPSELPVERLSRELHGVDWTGANVSVGDATEIAETYEMPKGKAHERTHRAVERTVTYDHPDADGVVEVQLRAAAEGVAVRYRVTGEAMEIFTGDGTTLSLPRDTVTWLTPFDHAHEASARQQPIVETEGEYCPPGLFRVDDEWLLLTEAGVDGDYAASRLVAGETEMTFGVPAGHLNAHFPLETPWRVAIVGDLATVVESTLVTDLAGTAEYDTDWVEPGRVAWSWWSESDSPDDFERQREYVDYAADRGWEYVLVDAGWPRRREEMPELIDYANDRGVDILLWSHWTDLNTESKREERLGTWADWGAAGIKVDFMDDDDQGRMQFYDDLAAEAAEHELLVNFHGSVVPTGLQRRYPHVMTYEGVMGAEYYKWSTVTPEHNCTLPFTRNVVGPMDYTPVTFSADAAQTTPGHELALSVVFESPLQHFADSVDEYAARPEAEGFLESVPAAWDETRFVGGHPGVEATVARRDGDEWFLGTITAGPQRIVTVDCAFLASGEADPSETWTAHVVRDETGGALASEEWPVTGEEALDIVVPENGGFAVRFTR